MYGRKIGLFILAVSLHAFAIPLKYEFKNHKTEKTVSITSMEIVPSKVTEKILSSKNAHGKTVIRKIPVEPMDTSKKGEKDALNYLQQVRDLVVIANEKTKFKKNKNMKKLDKNTNLKLAQVMLKIQIQKNGYFDILGLSGQPQENLKLVEQNIQGLKRFPAIPDNLELDELQLIMQMELKDLE